jgi:hypothetical protein
MGKLKILGEAVEGGLNAIRSAGRATNEQKAAEKYADPLKPATMRMSEALGNAGAEGKTLNFTEADRSRVFGSNRGGVGFSGLQHYSLPHQEANTVWGFGNKTTAEKKVKQNDPEKSLFTTFVGSPNQHKSNTVVLQDAVKEFQNAVKAGKVHPAQIELMNKRIQAATDEKTGARLFDDAYDLTDPDALKAANSFDRRSAIGDVLLGEGVKGPMRSKAFKEEHGGQTWRDSGKMESILKRETDPDLVDANTYDVGNRLFVLDNGIIHRPDLNVAFPYQVTGEDLGMKYQLVPPEKAMRDFYKMREGRLNKNGDPSPVSHYDLSRAKPSQLVDEDYLTFLQKEGHKDGGKVEDFDSKIDRLIEKHHFDNHVNKRIEEHFAKGGMPKLARTTLRMGKGGLLGKGAKALAGAMKGAEVMPAVEREANLAKFLEPSKVPQRLYHGTTATESGKGQEAIRRIKPSKEGALGSGVYLTPDSSRASGYAESPWDSKLDLERHSPNVLPVHAQIRNPLIIEGTHSDPMIEALVKLGVDEDKAANMVEKAYEEKGYIGKQVENRARAAGFDGLLQYRDGDLSEVVSYNPNAVKSAIGNQGTYDIYNPDLSKAKGGAILKHTSLRNRKPTQAQPIRLAEGGITLARTSLRRMKDGGKPEATIQATPRNKFLGAASDLLKSGHEFVSKPFGYDNPPAEMLSDFIGIPAASRVLDKLSYGEPITNYGKANVPLIPDDTVDAFSLGMGAVSPLSKLAKPLTKAIKMPELGNAVSSSVKLTGLQPEVKTALTGKPQGATYATKQEGPFYRVSPTSLDVTGAKSRGLREADELQGQASVAGSAGEVGREVPLRISDEEVARLISNPETNQPLQIAQRFTKETQGTEFAAPNIPESSLAKQSAIGRAHQLAVEGSPEYKTSVFDAYAKQMPDVLEQAGAKNYDDLMEKAYRQLAKETDEQFKQLPYNFSYHRKGEGDYLGGSKDMMADVHGNKHLYVFQGGDPHDFLNQMDKATGLNENEKFRAVHDLLGHAIYGNQFGPKGEEAAWAIHQQMYSPLARLAMTSETRGQNSLVNYSPLNVKLKSSIAKLEDLEVEARRRGDKALVNELQAAKRQEFANNFQFAPQKAVLLPPEFVDPKFAGGLPDYLSAANRPAKGTETQSVLTHFSNDPKLQMLDPKRYGTGIKGAEAERLNEYAGGVKDRSYVYLGEPGTIAPEPGLGVNRYRGESQNLYDITQDPLAFRALARESNRTPFTAKYNAGITHPLQEANDYERLVKEYGYEGMINPNASKPMGIMFKPTPVQPRARGGLTQLKAR